MGVAGLMTFLKDNRNSIGITTQLRPLTDEGLKINEPSALVVDAWSFIWALYNDHLPWATGGEHLAFDRLIRQVLEAWRRVGLRPYFVFDGPTPSSKHATVIRRLETSLQTSLLFFRTSTSSRSSPTFLASTPILPRFLFHVLRDVLASCKVTSYYLAEGEADGACVALAHELNGFVLGNDSDFTIFGGSLASSSAQTGYRGFVPIETLQWIASQLTQNQSIDPDGFAPVKGRTKGKRTSTTHSYRLIPPPRSDTTDHPTLVLLSFLPSELASRLRIPPSHLPLLASILGTDHSPPGAPDKFFHQKESKPDRIDKVARIIREALSPLGQSRIARLQKSRSEPRTASSSETSFASSNGIAEAGDQAFSFISYIISALIPPPNPRAQGSGLSGHHFDLLVSQMIDSCCQYILPPSPSHQGIMGCCETYPFCSCPSTDSEPLPFLSAFTAEEQPRIQSARKRYSKAQAAGHLSHLSAFSHPDRVYIYGILEEPEGTSLRLAERSRTVRRLAWELVANEVGGWRAVSEPEAGTVEADSTSIDTGLPEEDEDELVDVASEVEDEIVSVQSMVASTTPGPTNIVEYLRKGSSTRLAPFPLVLTLELDQYSSILLSPMEAREQHLLELCGSWNPQTIGLDPVLQPLVVILRVSISSVVDSKKVWTRKEVDSAVTASITCLHRWKSTPQIQVKDLGDGLLETRPATLVSRVLSAMLDVQQLAQALLLGKSFTGEESSDTHWGELYKMFEGSVWHYVLKTGSAVSWTEELALEKQRCLEAIGEGLEDRILGWQTWQAPEENAATVEVAKARKGGKGRQDRASRTMVDNDGNVMGRFHALSGGTF